MIVDPFAGCGDPLTSRNSRRMPNDRYQLAVRSCLYPENAETIVVIMESNSLNETGKNFQGRWFLLSLHVDLFIIGFGPGHANPTACRRPVVVAQLAYVDF
jgi:hypothetical protein